MSTNYTSAPVLLFILLSIFGGYSQANSEQDMLLIHQTNNLMYKCIGDYYMFNALEADQTFADAISDNIKQVNQRIEQLNNSRNVKIRKKIKSIQQQWERYQDLLASNKQNLLQQGFADGNQEYQMGEINMNISQQLTDLYNAEIAEDTKQLSKVSRSQIQSLRVMTAIFAAQYTVNPGQVFSGELAQIKLDDRLKDFSNNLSTLTQLSSNKGLLRSINNKWKMIEKSIQTKQDVMPYLVSKYTNLIIKDLNKLDASA